MENLEKLDLEKFSNVTDGRILSGAQALEIGLIDEIGTREQAISKAAELGGITGEPVVVTYFEQSLSLSDFFFSIGSKFGKGFWSSANVENSSIQTRI